MEPLDLVFDPLPPESLTRFLADSVTFYNAAKTGLSGWHPVGYFLKSSRGEWLGGVTGYVWGGWLHVTFLWVHETVRGGGQGARLMDAAEAFALDCGATAATVETFSFQAPGFYARRGYAVFGQLDDYPPGQTKFFLRKALKPVPSG